MRNVEVTDAEGKKISLYGFPIRETDERVVGVENREQRFDIKKLWSRQKEIIRLNSLGYKGTEIARMLGCHPITVSNALNSTLGKELSENIREERDEEYEQLHEEVLDLTRKSLDHYHRILDAEDDDTSVTPTMKTNVANIVTLELSGLRAPTRIESKSFSAVLTKSELDEFKDRGIAAAKASGKVINIEEENDSR